MAQLQKIAVLGGGAGSLAAAFYLSAQPGWQERYQITVYQQGWRLGGKGASGRNAALAFEAAVMGGMQATRAIGGYPVEIPGDSDVD